MVIGIVLRLKKIVSNVLLSLSIYLLLLDSSVWKIIMPVIILKFTKKNNNKNINKSNLDRHLRYNHTKA